VNQSLYVPAGKEISENVSKLLPLCEFLLENLPLGLLSSPDDSFSVFFFQLSFYLSICKLASCFHFYAFFAQKAYERAMWRSQCHPKLFSGFWLHVILRTSTDSCPPIFVHNCLVHPLHYTTLKFISTKAHSTKTWDEIRNKIHSVQIPFKLWGRDKDWYGIQGCKHPKSWYVPSLSDSPARKSYPSRPNCEPWAMQILQLRGKGEGEPPFG
jgi:hypothetical protein